MFNDDELRTDVSRYAEALALKAKSSKSSTEVVALDAWFRGELPGIINARQPTPFMTQPELVKLMNWKLARGKWRPKLQQLVATNDAKQVEEVTRQAFALLGESPKDALSKLCELKAVGPATASAILSVPCPTTEPFESDEAVEVLGLGKAQYTPAFFAKFREKVLERVKEGGWKDAEELERACWTTVILRRLAGPSKGGSVIPGAKPEEAVSKNVKRKNGGSERAPAKRKSARSR